jgi:hypothetical protein
MIKNHLSTFPITLEDILSEKVDLMKRNGSEKNPFIISSLTWVAKMILFVVNNCFNVNLNVMEISA